ncbi:MAG: transcription-repair coupling factor [Alphaproteobacteria bacterium]|nr:transcription-repair coupling factor [Alphaproteobacteria bacterium]
MMNNKISLCGIPNGYQGIVLKRLLQTSTIHCHIVANDRQLSFLQETISLLNPDIQILVFPNWDTVPYDRVSPKSEIVSERINTLIMLKELSKLNTFEQPVLILTTTAALLQKVPPMSFFDSGVLHLTSGQSIGFDFLKHYLQQNNYVSSNAVVSVGEYTVRGGLIDIFPTGALHPIRIDFFGDEIDSIKYFDESTQRTLKSIDKITLKPVSEYRLTTDSISLFRTKYRTLFDDVQNDYLYEAISNGIMAQGIEHFLPLFFEEMADLFDYLPKCTFSFDFQALESLSSRIEQITEYYEARRIALKNTDGLTQEKYCPISPDLFFLTQDEVLTKIEQYQYYVFSPYVEPDKKDETGRIGQTFVDVRVQENKDVFDAVIQQISIEKRSVILTASTFGAVQRLIGVFREHGLKLYEAHTWQESIQNAPAILVAPFVNGFSDNSFVLITETDMFGERVVQTQRKPKNKNFITDVNSLNIDDLVVHQIHGVGKYIGLFPIKTGQITHDCIGLVYAGGDKLFVPVENADVLSKYGSQNVMLDTLGSSSFLQRKERVKKDLFVMAERLINIASQRALNRTEPILIPHGTYQEFCMRFPYVETEDQLRTMQEVETDLSLNRPMDRLVCGDVGFGKTEIALRSAFLVAMAGLQVAIVAPTTLLAMQHAQTFIERFKGFPIRVGTLSRLVSSTKSKQIKKELANGTLDIVVGTHALLAKTISFKRLGLVIVDEEQHFGVAHKERLKELQKGVHVLTLTATPIPRTLQLSLAGVRELSIIATPPVDRLAVKTFVTPFDGVIIKEAILREHFRGGQIFFVCPRISDMDEVRQILKELVPDIRVVEAHGQMGASSLEKIMQDFAQKKYDILLATSIIESGLDMPSVNTIIIYRADMFGLSALYQMRGRVGRGKLRAYAYLTTPPYARLNTAAQKRLNVMQSLDSLGAGFTLASHDLDIRGAGNLLGQEQSGHIREVGVALYQKMLSDAIQTLKKNNSKEVVEVFSPQISVGLSVFIPETYITDLDTRMDLYQRIGHIETLEEIDLFKDELVDRFGLYPKEVDNLFLTIRLKILCKKAHIDRLDIGEKGATISFHQNIFPNPTGLIDYITSQMGTIRIRSDQKLVVLRPFSTIENRLKSIEDIIMRIANLV